MKPFRVAVIGLGSAAHTLHFPALAGLPSVVVAGAYDLNESRRHRAAKAWNVPVFDSFDALLVRARPDVIVVGTPPDSHADYVVRSLNAGAHVICEKPFVSSLEEADRVIELSRATGRLVALNHEFREMPIFRALRDAVAKPGREVLFAQVWQLVDLAPWAEPGWRGQMRQRTLYEAGVHLVDFLIALFGERPGSVSATVSSGGVRESESDAVALCTLEFSRGRLAQIVQNRLCKGETQYFEVRADTGDSSLRASFGGRARLNAGLYRSMRPYVRFDYGISGLAWEERDTRRRVLGRNPKNPTMMATRYVFERAFAAFAGDGRPLATAEDARTSLEVIAAAYHSAAMGRRITLSPSELSALHRLHLGAAPATATPLG